MDGFTISRENVFSFKWVKALIISTLTFATEHTVGSSKFLSLTSKIQV